MIKLLIAVIWPVFVLGTLVVIPPRPARADDANWMCDQVNSATLAPGSGYVPGTYTGVALDGGTGSGVVVTVVVGSDGIVAAVRPEHGGQWYSVGDVLTGQPGAGGSGFGLTVTSLSAMLYDGSGNPLPMKGLANPCVVGRTF